MRRPAALCMYEILRPPSSIFYPEWLVDPSPTGGGVLCWGRLCGRCSVFEECPRAGRIRNLTATSSRVSVLFVLTISKVERLHAAVLRCVKKWDTLQFCGGISKAKHIENHVQ